MARWTVREPIRFPPALTFPLAIHALQRLAHGTARIEPRTLGRAAAFIAVLTLLTYFSAEGGLFFADAVMRLVMVPVIFGGGTLVLVHLLREPTDRDPRVSRAMLVSVLAWLLSLVVTPTIGGTKWPYAVQPDTDAIRPTGRPGYVLGLCDRGSALGRPEQLGELFSGRYLLYGQRRSTGTRRSGRLHLNYQPVSWRWTRRSLLRGLLAIGGTVAGLAVDGRRRARPGRSIGCREAHA